MPETFHELIARNKRNTWMLLIVFMVFFVAMGLLIGYAWGGTTPFAVAVSVGAGVVAFILMMSSYYGGSSVLLSMSGAREITHADDPQLFNVVEELSIAGGLPMPRVFLIDEPAMNAFATGRNPQNAVVAITRGLRERLTRDELQGVIGHELSHVRNYDILFAMLVAVMVGTMVMLSDIFLRSLWYGAGSRSRSRSRDSNSGGGGIQIVLIILAVVFAIIAPLLAKIVQMAISRQREFLADAGSVALTRNPHGLASALAKLGGDEEVLRAANRATAALYIVHPVLKAQDDQVGEKPSIFDTHPPIRERIERLMAMAV